MHGLPTDIVIGFDIWWKSSRFNCTACMSWANILATCSTYSKLLVESLLRRGILQKFHCQFNFTGVPGVLRSETPCWVAFWPRLATDRGGHRWTLQEERHRSPPDLSTPPPPPPTPSLRDLLRDTQAHRDIVSKQTKQTIPQFFSENIIVSRNNGDANRIYLFICFLRRNTPDPHWEPVKY